MSSHEAENTQPAEGANDAWWETAGDLSQPERSASTRKEAAGTSEGGERLPENGRGGWRPGTAASSILARAFKNRTAVPEKTAPSALERLLQSIAGDYGTHALVLEALIELLIAKGVMTEDEFEDLLEVIDARDGQIDGTLGDPSYHLGAGI